VALSSDGTVDTTRTSQSDLVQANNLLAPLKSFAQSQTSPELDTWKLLNGLFVGYYWFVLGDLAQVSPVTYNTPSGFLVPSSFSQPAILHPSTNNLFLNTTLARTVFSNIGLNGTGAAIVDAITIPNWGATTKPLPKFRWLYLCNQRQLKPWLDLIVSVFGLALSLLHVVYSVGIIVLGWIMSRSRNNVDNIHPGHAGDGRQLQANSTTDTNDMTELQPLTEEGNRRVHRHSTY
jgi:hypothetical protein